MDKATAGRWHRQVSLRPFVYPNEGVTVAVLANVEAPVHLIRDKLARLAFGESITLNSERNGLALSTEQLKPLAGIYELRPGYEIVIAIQDGQLTGQLRRFGPAVRAIREPLSRRQRLTYSTVPSAACCPNPPAPAS